MYHKEKKSQLEKKKYQKMETYKILKLRLVLNETPKKI